MENNHRRNNLVEVNKTLNALCNTNSLADINDTNSQYAISPSKSIHNKLSKQRSKSEDHLEDLINRNNGEREDESFNIKAYVQFSGYLYKQPFGSKGKSKKWQRRFFVIKEGFLLYYPESEGRDFEKNRIFNIHPKGVIPLGGCEVEKLQIQGHRFSLTISHPSFVGGSVVVAVISESSQDEWYQAIKDCSKVTWKNNSVGAEVNKDLDENTKQFQLEKTLQEEKDQLELKAEQLVNELSTVTAELKAITKAKLSAEEDLKSFIEAAARWRNETESYKKKHQNLEKSINRLSSDKLAAKTKSLYEHKSQAKTATDKKLGHANAADNINAHISGLCNANY